MSDNPFVTARLDGRSDKRVIVDLIGAAQPEQIFGYDELIEVLQQDAPNRAITRQTIGHAVREANKVALVECQRCLQSVARVGYRVAAASDHRILALDRRRKADSQIRMAVHTLQHVRWDEMDAASREAHQATLVLMAGMWQAVEAIKQRQDKMADLLQRIVAGNPA